MKNWKTSLLGVFALMLAVSGVILVAYEKATLLEVGGYLGAITPFVIALGLFWSKDHNKDNNEDIASIPGGGIPKEPKEDRD